MLDIIETDNNHQIRLRILVVDDNTVIRDLLDDFLQLNSYIVLLASDGKEAIEILKNNEIAIVISDVQMPHIDGLKLLKYIKKNHPQTDVIIMTGHLKKYSYSDVIQGGAIDYINKPFALEEIDAKLNRVIRERNTIQELLKSRKVLEKKAATEKERLEGRLLQAQRMEAIGVLAGGIAHDFNNILGVILGFTDMAKDLAPVDSQIYVYTNKVLKAGRRAKNLVKQILTFSRQQQVENIIFQPAPVIKETVKFIRSSIPTSIEIKSNIQTNCRNIQADPTQLHQVVMNLCINAYQAIEGSDGLIEVTLENFDTKEVDSGSLTTLNDGIYVKLQVRDTGSGISPLIIDRVFEPYFTSKEVGKGTGMGLALVHGIIKNCGGVIIAESILGEGAVFTVYLPVVESQVKNDQETILATHGDNERILFVDDDEIMSELGKDMLVRLGYNVTNKISSIEALETFKKQPDQFDLIITDQTMPGLTGVELAKRILQIRPDTPIVLCTGYSTTVSSEQAKEIGIKAFALKPLVKNDFGTIIRKVLAGEDVFDH